MNISNFFGKILCKIGMHKGDFYYQTSNSCETVRTCQRCERKTTRVYHKYNDGMYKESGSCDVTYTCKRCNHAKVKVEHQWGNRTVRSDLMHCTVYKLCDRCNEKRVTTSEHTYGQWSYDKSREMDKRECIHCGLPDYRTAQNPPPKPVAKKTAPVRARTVAKPKPKKRVSCGACAGRGTIISYSSCSKCGGSGRQPHSPYSNMQCTRCRGASGGSQICNICGGSGSLYR